ncbi:MAG TPA: GFA family protein [Polyangiaceae bacterium]|nr:GFA family protein [Polyangiaceae bacterium]
MSSRRAACHCGQLKLSCAGEPTRVSMCHCLDCQRRTGSAFGVQARFQREDVTVEGRAAAFTRAGDSGGRCTFHFCPACGSTVYWEPHGQPEFRVVAVGAFADPAFSLPSVSLYEERKHPWVALPDNIEHVD